MKKKLIVVGRHSDRFLSYLLKFKRNRNASDGDWLLIEAAKKELARRKLSGKKGGVMSIDESMLLPQFSMWTKNLAEVMDQLTDKQLETLRRIISDEEYVRRHKEMK